MDQASQKFMFFACSQLSKSSKKCKILTFKVNFLCQNCPNLTKKLYFVNIVPSLLLCLARPGSSSPQGDIVKVDTRWMTQ